MSIRTTEDLINLHKICFWHGNCLMNCTRLIHFSIYCAKEKLGGEYLVLVYSARRQRWEMNIRTFIGEYQNNVKGGLIHDQ